MIGNVKIRVAMRFMNEWKLNTLVLDRQTIIWRLFSCSVHYPSFVVAMEASDACADVGVCCKGIGPCMAW
jgi:hypothetical protein